MTGLPTVQVLLDDGSGTFPHDVTAYARLLDGFSFTRGREDEQSAPTAGTLSLSLNNGDGRFTPGSTIIGSPSRIKVDQRIRLKETVNGVTHTRFTGYVKSWRVGWPAAVDTHSVVRITATCAQARAERRILKSVVEEEILADDPTAYYTLGEPAGSLSVADSSGNQAPALTMAGSGTDVVFDNATGPGTDGLTAATFAAGKYLIADVTAVNALSQATLAGAFSTTGADQSIAILHRPGSSARLELSVDTTWLRAAIISDSGGATSATAVVVNDGETHFAEVTFQAGVGLSLYLDGNLIDTSASTLPGNVLTASKLGIGCAVDGAGGVTGGNLTGVVAHAAYFTTALSAARAGAQGDAALTGFAGESGTDRITRLAGYAGIPLGTLDTSLTNVPFKDFTGTSAWSAIQEVVDAEGGLGYVNGSGNLTFVNRNDAPEKTTPDLTLTAEFVDFSAEPTDDDAELVNHFETTAEGTGVMQVVRDAVSIEGDANSPGHGEYPESKSYLVQTDAEALDRANWIVGTKAEPTSRFGTLTVNLYKMTAAQASSAIAALEPGAWLRVTGMPSQTPGGTTADVMVQGFAEEQSGTGWALTCNVVDRSLFTAGIYDDATYGLFDDARFYF